MSTTQVDRFSTTIPQHVCIIMDGNRRWARKNKLQVFKGHEKVAFEMMDRLIDRSIKRGVKYLTLWAFSTENWKRSQKEVGALLSIFRQMFERDIQELHQKGVRFNTIGDMSRFPEDIQQNMSKMKQESQQNKTITVTFALNYGGHDELLRAIRQMTAELEKEAHSSDISLEKITKEKLEQYLDTTDLPDPDFIIRTGGEQRLSGFMSWQSAYAELYFPQVLMPDFDEVEFDKALIEFDSRQRRFGA
ncbi:MAG: di-trans,poly-cis-decaprenylcistransferase [Candidatus Pacebacteria bacterium]|nr:di-trans,poly-cis-decaprenylcistransferase [Candidatus Paceibacterota bacterium]